MFNNVDKSCVVYLDRFINRSTESWIDGTTWKEKYLIDYDGRIMLRDFFLDSEGNFKFTPKLASRVNPDGTGLFKLPDGMVSRYDGNLPKDAPK